MLAFIALVLGVAVGAVVGHLYNEDARTVARILPGQLRGIRRELEIRRRLMDARIGLGDVVLHDRERSPRLTGSVLRTLVDVSHDGACLADAEDSGESSLWNEPHVEYLHRVD